MPVDTSLFVLGHLNINWINGKPPAVGAEQRGNPSYAHFRVDYGRS
jgi:hypothetical protein